MTDSTSRTIPWPGRFVRLSVDERSVNLFARHTDGPDGAIPFFHVHGLGGASTNWTDLATALQQYGPSIALDLPGWGESDPAPDGNYSVSAAARWTIAAIEALADGPVHLVGNSMGGLISIRIAAQRPDLVRTLTLISPAVPGLEAPTDADPRLALLAMPFLGNVIARQGPVDAMARAKMSAAICFAHPENIPLDRLQQQADEAAVRAGYPWANAAFSGSLRSLVAAHLHRRKDHPWRLAAQLDVPTAIVWGEADRLVPVKRAPKLAATIEGSTLRVLEEVGHTAQLEAPVETAEEVVALLERAQRSGGSAGRSATEAA